MKMINSVLLNLTFLCLLTTNVTAAVDIGKGADSKLAKQIQCYLSTLDNALEENSATVFVNFLSVEDGQLYSVDFMVEEDQTIVVLSKTLEDEFYRVKDYRTDFIQRYSVPVMNVSLQSKDNDTLL